MQNLMGMMPGPFGQSEPLWKKIVTNSAGGSKYRVTHLLADLGWVD